MGKETTKTKKAKSPKSKGDEPVGLSVVDAFDGVGVVTVGEYKGKPTITLGEEGARFPFTFGAGKARLLVLGADTMGSDEFIEALRVLADTGASSEG